MLAGQLLENNSTYPSFGGHPHGHSHGVTKSLEIAIPFTILSGTFSLFGGLSNLALMVILIKYVQITQKTYLYMFSLFLSECLYNFFFQPQVAYNNFPSTTPTKVGIKFLHFCATTFLLTGVSSLFFATLDKYIFISYPFVYASRISQTKTILLVAFIWLFCVFCGFLRTVFHFPYTAFVAIMAVLFLLTIALQILIFVFARRQIKRIQLVNRALEHNSHGQNSGGALRAVSSPNKATKTIGLMLAIYIFSWLPSTLYRLKYLLFGGDPTAYLTNIKWINMLVQIHSCVNPYIFVFRTKEVRVGVENMLRRFGLNRIAPLLSDRGESCLIGYNRGAMNNLYIGGDETRSVDNANGKECDKDTETTTCSTNLITNKKISNRNNPNREASNEGRSDVNVRKNDTIIENYEKEDKTETTSDEIHIDKRMTNEKDSKVEVLPLSVI